MNIEQATTIFLEMCMSARIFGSGNIEKAASYIKKSDVKGFERICRCFYGDLYARNIPYELTDGEAERWHENGTLWYFYNYVSGELNGLGEEWSEDGVLSLSATYKDGDLVEEIL
jgi:antitoxin component YwqK of YwqJK toxin-antitoxin module